MSERVPKEESGYVVSEVQSRFFKKIGMDIPANMVIPFREKHIQVMQGNIDGLSIAELSAKMGIAPSTIDACQTQISGIGQKLAKGANGYDAAISCAVGIGRVSASEIMPKTGVEIDKTKAAILGLMIQGYDIDEISRTLYYDEKSIRLHRQILYEELGVEKLHRKKSAVAVAIAVELLKQGVDQSEAQT